jgi:hypothetical protein
MAMQSAYPSLVVLLQSRLSVGRVFMQAPVGRLNFCAICVPVGLAAAIEPQSVLLNTQKDQPTLFLLG